MEYPKHLHIDYAKDAYRASNKQDYVKQMALWLQCQEAIHHRTAYHAWRQLKKPASKDAVHRSLGGGIDDSDVKLDTGDCPGEGAGKVAARGLSGM